MVDQNSSPSRVGEWNLQLDLAKIEQQWPSLMRVLEDPATFERLNPKVSLWSAGLQAGHIAMATSFMAQMVQECLDDPVPNESPQWADFTELVFRKGGFRRGAAQAPEVMQPASHDRDYFLRRLQEAQAHWGELMEQAAAIQSASATRKHVAFGDLRASDWVRLCALHNAHHLRIIEDILSE